MMYYLFRVVLLLVVLLCIGCQQESPTPAVLPNLLVNVEGKVEIKRKGSLEFVPASIGTYLQISDTLRLIEGKASVFCGDLSAPINPVLIDKNVPGVPCITSGIPSPLADTYFRDQQSDFSDIPYVLSPRSGFVNSNQPILRWHTLKNTDVYTLALISDAGYEDTPVIARGEKIAYPIQSWKPLQEQKSYILEIKTGVSSSLSDDTSGIGFSLLNSDDRKILEQLDKVLRECDLDKVSLVVVLANLYMLNTDSTLCLQDELDFCLHSEAVEILLSEPDNDQIPSIQLLLGKVYWNMHLASEAKQAFDRAQTLAEIQNLPEMAVIAQMAKSWIACKEGDLSNFQMYQAKASKMTTAGPEFQMLKQLVEECESSL